MSISETETEKEKAKRQFQFCESELLRGLNGIGRPMASLNEAADLRRALMQAQQICKELGVEAETLWEFAIARRKEDEAAVRQFARAQLHVVPLLARGLRRQIAIGAAVCVVALVISEYWSLGGFFASMFAGLIAFALVESVLAEFFPTPPIRVGRMACQKGVNVCDLWPESSPDAMDYECGYRGELFRMKRRGDDIGLRAR